MSTVNPAEQAGHQVTVAARSPGASSSPSDAVTRRTSSYVVEPFAAFSSAAVRRVRSPPFSAALLNCSSLPLLRSTERMTGVIGSIS